MVPVVANVDVILLVALLGSRYLLHLSDFRHAKFGVVVEEHTTKLDGQVVLGPIPQLTQVLVVQRMEGIDTKRDREEIKTQLNCLSKYIYLERRGKKRRLTLALDAAP